MVILYRVGDPPVLPSKAMDSSSEWVCKITKPTVQGVDEPPSMTLCYTKAVSSPPRGSVVRVLLFNLTGRRDNRALIEPLMVRDGHSGWENTEFHMKLHVL